MDMKLYGLPGSVVIIGLIYAMGLAIVPAPGNSAQTAAPLQTEAEPSSAAAAPPAPPLAMPMSNERTGYLRAHVTLAPDSTDCAHISDAAAINAAILHARHMQLQRGTGEHEPATGPAPPGKLTFF